MPRTGKFPLNVVLLVVFSLLYFAGMIVPAAERLLWFDEVITVSVARLPRLPMLWSALMEGADNNPPLYHLAVRAAFAALGEREVAARLPAMVGVWVLAVCLYALVARRLGAAYGWAALLIPLSTAASAFAGEARPYGLLLGCTGAALLCWQSAAEGRRRPAWLAGLALGLAVGVTSHYYAVLLPVPLAAGELVRTAGRRRADPWVWLAIGAGMLPLAGLYPLTRVLREHFMPNFWAQPVPLSIPRAYGFLFEHALPPLAAALLAFALLARGRPSPPPGHGDEDEAGAGARRSLPTHEVVAAAVLLGMPFYAYLLGLTATGVFADRYVLPAIAGFAILLPALASRLGGGRASWGWVLAGCFLASAPLSLAWDRWTLRHNYLKRETLYKPILERLAPGDKTPIAVSDPYRYAMLICYGPKSLRSKLVYICTGDETADRNVIALGRWTGLQVANFREFIASSPRFHLHGRLQDGLAMALVNWGALVQLHYLDDEVFLAHVVIPKVEPGEILSPRALGSDVPP